MPSGFRNDGTKLGFQKGHKGYWLGKHLPKKCKIKQSETLKRMYKEGKLEGFPKGHISWSKGKKFPKRSREKMSISAIERCKRDGPPKCGFKKGEHRSRETEFKKGQMPWNKGKHHTEKSKKKMSLAKKGKKNPKLSETKKRLFREGKLKPSKGAWKEGHKPWNKGLTKETDDRVRKLTERGGKTRKRLFREGKIKTWSKGLTKETDERIRRLGERGSNTKKKMSLFKGDKNPAWRGGISFLPYSSEFNDDLKLIIRFRDNFECQLCPTKENGRAFPVHHVDYNKKHNTFDNLITLCDSCHGKTQFNREYWTNYFQNLMVGN